MSRIAAWLGDHTPADAGEADAIAALRALGPVCDRAACTPGHITASGLVFRRDLLAMALVWHAGFGRWIQPGGHLEPGESPVEAAHREIREETGLDAQLLGLVDVERHEVPASDLRAEPAHCHLDLRYAWIADGPLAEGARWLALDAVAAEADASVARGLARWLARPLTHAATFTARWADMDYNQHMRNGAYLACAEDVRMGFLARHGYDLARFRALRIGPVVLEDRLTYRREIGLLQPFTVDLAAVALTPDAARARIRNRFRDPAGRTLATVDSAVCWLDLDTRRPVAPPPDLARLWLRLVRTDDYAPWPDTASGRPTG